MVRRCVSSVRRDGSICSLRLRREVARGRVGGACPHVRLLFRRVESRRAPESVDAPGGGRGSRKIRQLLAIVRGGLLVAFPDQGCRETVVGLVSVVKVAEAYSRHGDERGGLSRAIRQVAGQSKLADGCGDGDSRGGECVRGPMGHRAAMRGRRRVFGGCARVAVGVLRCWRAVVSRWSGVESCTADGESERATTGMVWSGEASERGWCAAKCSSRSRVRGCSLGLFERLVGD